MNKNIKKSFKYFKDSKKDIVLLGLLYLLNGIGSFITPIILAKLITSITNIDYRQVVILVIIQIIVLILQDFLWHLTHLLWKKKIRTRMLFNIRKELLDTVFDLEMINFDLYSTGRFQERVKNDPVTISKVVNTGQKYLINCITKISILIYIFIINWVIGLIYLFGIIFAGLIDNYRHNISKEKNKIVKKSDEEVNSILSETIRGIRDVKLLNFKNQVKKLITNKLNFNNSSTADRDTFNSKYDRITHLIIVFTVGAVIVIGMLFVKMNIITASSLIILYMYNSDIFSLTDNMSKLKDCIKEYELAIERIYTLLDEKEFKREKFGKVNIKNFKGKISFENVKFSYNENNEILKNLSFDIEEKDTVALVGASGSGKSTILNLIAKSYDVSSGSIKLDNININELSENTIRNNISIITQNPYIFNMSIMDNLKLVNSNATKKEIEQVCKKACFYDFIESLPKKFDTIIGENGLNLSGGQKQRLAIARALLKKSKIILLDEATSSLDNITQKEIKKSIDNISKDYTIVIVAHRLSTIKDCTKIFVLSDGKIVSYGTHNELLKNSKYYKSLYDSEIKKTM